MSMLTSFGKSRWLARMSGLLSTWTIDPLLMPSNIVAPSCSTGLRCVDGRYSKVQTSAAHRRHSKTLGYTFASSAPARHYSSGSGPSDSDDPFKEFMQAFVEIDIEVERLLSEGDLVEAEALLREAVKQGEEILGAGAFVMASPLTKLAEIQFMTDRCQEAQDSAKRAYDAFNSFAVRDGAEEEKGLAAAYALRHATTLLGAGEPHEAANILKGATKDLDAAIAWLDSAAGKAEDLPEFVSRTFERARGEAGFYSALCSLITRDDTKPEDIESVYPQMEQGIATMLRVLGIPGAGLDPLIQCALREHQRVADIALNMGHIEIAQSLYKQLIQLHQQAEPHGEKLLPLFYTLGTLQYCIAKFEDSAATMQQAVSMLDQSENYSDVDANVLSMHHRLGMALGALGKVEDSRASLLKVAPGLVRELGEGNPVSTELEFMLALLALKEECGADRARSEELMGQMADATKVLKEIGGKDHPIVEISEKLMSEAREEVSS